MRPYLEATDFLGLLRFLLKNFLIFILNLNSNVIVSRLAIPYSRSCAESFRWIRDNYNTEKTTHLKENRTIPVELSGISSGSKIITLPGHLQARKNPLEAYKKIEELRKIRKEKIFLVFAGSQDRSFKRELTKKTEFIDTIMIDRLLEDSELNGLIFRSDLIFLPYTNRGASGIVLNSIVIGTPVLIYGTDNWSKLHEYLGDQLIVSTAKSLNSIHQMSIMLDCVKSSGLFVLQSENVHSLSDFIFGDIS
jgi:hypothetical protein